MALYTLTRWNSGVKADIDTALEALETYLETIDDAKTIYFAKCEMTGRDRTQAVAYALHAT